MTSDEDTKSKRLAAYCYEAAMIRYADRNEELKRKEGRRFHGCRTMGVMRDCVGALPDSPQKAELLNMSNLLLRMYILENDGGPLSPSKLNGF